LGKPQYIKWIAKEQGVTFEDGVPLNCYALDYTLDDNVLDDWALHIRRHYIDDDELAESIEIHKLSVEDYLRKYIIPQKNDEFGSTSRSNDITEILVSDLLEFILHFTVPRCKQNNRSGKSLSEHGTDVIAYKFYSDDKTPNKRDILCAAEVKATLTSNEPDAIKSAVKDSFKDEQRFSHTLDHMRKKLKYLGNIDQALEVARFQQKSDMEYITRYIAAGVSSQPVIDKKVIIGIKGSDLVLKDNQRVFYIHGQKLMDLTHDVFERCIR